MPDLRDWFSRADGDPPGLDAIAERRVVARRRRRRRVVAGAFVVAVVVAGSAVALAERHVNHHVANASSAATTKSAPPAATAPGTTAPPTETLGYPSVATHPEAFRGFGQLAYESGAALRILDGTGAPPRSVPLPGALEQARWSPDGAWLAIQTDTGPYAGNGQGEVFVVRADGTDRVRVPVAVAGWAWSPTRDVLAVVNQLPAARNGSITLYAAPDFTTPTSTPIPGAEPAGFIAWAPDGARLFYKTYTPRPPFVDRLWSVDETDCPPACSASPRAVPVAVPRGEEFGFDFAGWSADGTRLLIWLDAAHSGSIALDGLAVASVPLGEGREAQLPAMLTKPSWLADVPGTERAIVAVGRERFWDSHRQLDTCGLDTGACTTLVNDPGPTIDPAVSPDGRQLAYVATDAVVFANNAELPPKSSIRWTRSRRLVIAGIDNQDPHVIATGGVVAPRWTGDGSRIVFWRAGYLWLVDPAHPAPIAIVGKLEPAGAGTDSIEPFADNAYIVPGNDVWDSVAWLAPKA